MDALTPFWDFISGGRAVNGAQYREGVAREVGGCLLEPGCINSLAPGGGATVPVIEALSLRMAAVRLPAFVGGKTSGVMDVPGGIARWKAVGRVPLQ